MTPFPEVSNELDLIYAIALHGVGRVDAAEALCMRLVGDERDMPKRNNGEPEDDADLRNFTVRVWLLLATVRYDRGDFRGYWTAIRKSAGIDPIGLPPTIQAAIVVCKCALARSSGESRLRELDDLIRTPGLNSADIGELELARVETLLQLAGHSGAIRPRRARRTRGTVPVVANGTATNRPRPPLLGDVAWTSEPGPAQECRRRVAGPGRVYRAACR